MQECAKSKTLVEIMYERWRRHGRLQDGGEGGEEKRNSTRQERRSRQRGGSALVTVVISGAIAIA